MAVPAKNGITLATAGDARRANASLGTLAPGSANFLFCGFFTLSNRAADAALLSLWDTSGNNRAYEVLYQTSNDRLLMIGNTLGTGAGNTIATANNYGGIRLEERLFFEAYKISSVLGIRINRGINNITNPGAADTTALAGTIFASTADFAIGCQFSIGARFNGWSGRLDEIYQFHTNMPSSTELDFIYNNRYGRSYAEYAQKVVSSSYTAPAHHWGFEEASGTFTDSVGSLALTANGTVTRAEGLVISGCPSASSHLFLGM